MSHHAGTGRPGDVRAADTDSLALVDDSQLLLDLVTAVVARYGGTVGCCGTGWRLEPGPFWCVVRPPGRAPRGQGWKLHVSATELSAPVVLARAARVLVRAGCLFKFARDLGQLGRLLSPQVDRASGGKFITVYPADDDQLRELATALDQATDGLPGPVVLSDRQWRPGSLVSYRYGGFDAPAELDNDGRLGTVLIAPDGRRVPDRRSVSFDPPPWATPPRPGAPADQDHRSGSAADHRSGPKANRQSGPMADHRSGSVLIADRFVVRAAVRHSYRGGVYRATDRHSGDEVILKHARPHVLGQLTGGDARDGLRNEAAMLRLVGPLGVAPQAVALVPYQNSLFLAEELIPGVTLRRWVAQRAARWAADGPPLAEVLRPARDLVRILAAVHGHGVVLRDLSPNNIMVRPDGTLAIIDLEHATPAGSRVTRIFTPGYGAPEQLAAPWYGEAPPYPADLYSLGAVLIHLATGMDPLLCADLPALRGNQERIAELVGRAAAQHHALDQLSPLILGLMAEDARQRWRPARADEFLTAMSTSTPPSRPAAGAGVSGRAFGGMGVAGEVTGGAGVSGRVGPGEGVSGATLDRLITDGLDFLVCTMTPHGQRLWPASQFGATTDPLNVQHGAAGVLGVLARGARVLGDARLRAAAGTAAAWIDRRLQQPTRLLPGLYFGRSGTAWALHDAAGLLADPAASDRAANRALDRAAGLAADLAVGRAADLAAGRAADLAVGRAADLAVGRAVDRAVELLGRLPVRWPNPDVCHGSAGAGLAHVHLARATGRADLTRRVLLAADHALSVAQERDGHLVWPVPRTFDSTLAGAVHYGFAHGVAGVGAFLLSAAVLTGRAEYLAAAQRAAETLQDAARIRGAAARWPSDAGDTGDAVLVHWCSGSSGIGTFLIRLWAHTGEHRWRELAEAAALAVTRDRWRSPVAVCHGLAGDGEFLLDLAHFTGDEEYRHRAGELAAAMYARRVERDGRTVLPDESGSDVTAGYGTGLSGAVGFLLRLRHGGGRWWMPDEGLPASATGARPGAAGAVGPPGGPEPGCLPAGGRPLVAR